VVTVPYVMPGFDLARCCADLLHGRLNTDVTGVILLNHGIFTFAADAREAYRRMIELVTLAELHVAGAHARSATSGQEAAPAGEGEREPGEASLLEIATLRRQVSRVAGAPMVLTRREDPVVLTVLGQPSLAAATQRGPATPDHVIRTKRRPLLGRDAEAYAAEYRDYFARHQASARTPVTMLDPAPRVILDPALGLLGAGRRAQDADAAAEIAVHTLTIMSDAEALGGYQALPEADIFAVEYWELEQAKLKKAPAVAELTGQVALVTGAASGIGRACALALAGRGACVAGVDISPEVDAVSAAAGYLGIHADVTDPEQVRAALRRTVERFGGLDIVVAAAGVFGVSSPLAALDKQAWRSAMTINADAVAQLLAAVHPLLALAPTYGRVVLIGSRNVTAPGPGAAAYSASKAAATQLARMAALEWAADGIRVNIVHPDAVFDTGLWTPRILSERASHYGLTVDEYKRRNLLKTEVTSATVGQAVAALCSPAFAATTGAQIPIDGGSERTI
jgi:NAD(P)-dependent dehydrogenase (short-subunit alcohol dehydrogenase family)